MLEWGTFSPFFVDISFFLWYDYNVKAFTDTLQCRERYHMLKTKLIAILCIISMLTSVTALAAENESGNETTALTTALTENVEESTAETEEVTENSESGTETGAIDGTDISTYENTDTSTAEGTDTGAADTDDFETSDGTGTSTSDTDDPEEKPSPAKVQDIVYKFLTEDLELTPAAAAGIMGNVMIECTFDPTALAMDTNGLYSFGLMMWNGPRFEALKKWCADNGYDHEDPLGQLGYLKWELLNTEKSAYAVMKEIPNTIEGACKAAILWASDFERCTRTSFGLRIYYALNMYWPNYAGGSVSDTHGIYGYYYNVPENIKYGTPLALYGAVVSFSSNIKSITVGVFTEDGELVTGRTLDRDALVANIGVLDSYIVFNKVPRGNYYYTISAVNEAEEYIVERHRFTVSDEPTSQTLVKESIGSSKCSFGIFCPGTVFSDMPSPTNWAHDGIDYVVDAGLFEGKPGGIFAPKENMSRAMFVTVLCRLGDMLGVLEGGDSEENTDSSDTTVIPDTTADTSGSDDTEPVAPSESVFETVPFEGVADISEPSESESGTSSAESDSDASDSAESDSDLEDVPVEDTFDYYFKDVKKGKWYTEAVYRAANAGLVMGKSADTFAPNEPLTRAQLATLMYRFANLCGADTSISAEFSEFADGETVPAWAKDAMSWAVAAGLVTGSNNSGTLVLDPRGYATRAQVAAIVQRFVVFIESGYAPETPDNPESVSTGTSDSTEGTPPATGEATESGTGTAAEDSEGTSAIVEELLTYEK